MEATCRGTVWWSDQGKNDNKPIDQGTWGHLKSLVSERLSGKRLYVMDTICGANKNSQLKVRFIVEVAWQAHFVKNMFIRPSEEELDGFEPDFIVMNGAKCSNPQWQDRGLNSENFVAFNLSEKIQLIGGTWYGGEMKKGLFSMMNYLLPLQGMASMHCSANIGENGDTAIFFGLSGTGKRISIHATRAIIRAILNGSIDNAESFTLPYFNLDVPMNINAVDNGILDPRSTYEDPAEWDEKARNLAELFVNNFEKFTDTDEGKKPVAAGPELAEVAVS